MVKTGHSAQNPCRAILSVMAIFRQPSPNSRKTWNAP
jgi:hypothetical protein